jgi:hypothetical protein
MVGEPTPKTGQLVWYPYLWSREREDGETEGRKERPCCLLIPALNPASGKTVLYLLAISTLAPGQGQKAIPIPEIERRRAGLADWKAQSWVYVSEYNRDVLQASFYFEPGEAPIGSFSAPFVRKVAIEFRSTVLARAAKAVDRQGGERDAE